MRKLLVLVVLLSLGCGKRDWPVLAVDTTHSQTRRPDNTEAPPYEIKPAAGVVLDSSNYQFPAFSKIIDRPNSVQLVGGEKLLYAAPFDPAVRTNELSADTLTALRGSPAFAGFKDGETYIVAIGNQGEPPAPGKPAPFRVMWLAMIQVKK